MFVQRLFLAVLASLLLLLGSGADGARILALATMPSPSHGIWNRVLLEALAARGHKITALVPYPTKNTTGIEYHIVGGHFDDGDLIGLSSVGPLGHVDAFFGYAHLINAAQASSPAVHQFLVQPEKLDDYDLVLYEAMCSESLAGVFSKISAPIVAFDAYADASWNWESMGVANYPSVYHQPLFPFRTEMAFWERVQNFAYEMYDRYARSNYLKVQQALAKQVFGKNAADLKEVEANFDLFLTNSGISGLDLVRTLPPNVKEVGCLHCRPSVESNIPKDVKEFLDGAKDGFVYFSFGSNLKSSLLPQELIQELLAVFEKLKPLRVLWKFEKDDLPGKPSNVKINRWLPQQDVLEHKNIRLFISHGGRLSIQESIYHGTPVFVVPFFADQYLNGERMVEQGMGLRMNFANFDVDEFESNIRKINNENAKFMAAAKRLSALARDQPETSLERAVYWIEYVIRHAGAKHLRPPGAHLNWFQLHSLDVIASLLIFAITPLALIALVCRKCCGGTRKRDNAKKNK